MKNRALTLAVALAWSGLLSLPEPASSQPLGVRSIHLDNYLGGNSCNGVDDVTAGFNAALAAAQSGSERGATWIFIPAGTSSAGSAPGCLFLSKPNDVPEGVQIVGGSSARSRLIRGYNGGGPFLHIVGAGAGARDLSVLAAAGTSLGNAFKIIADNSTANGHDAVLQNVLISGLQ